MFSKYKLTIIFLAITFFSILSPAYSAPATPLPSDDVAQIGSLEVIFAQIISISGILLGFGFFVVLVRGGIKYLLSGGDPKAVQEARGAITWAIAGLAILVLSYTILLIIKAFTGVDVTRLKITGYDN